MTPKKIASGKKNKHQIKTEKTKQRILATAEPLFADNGFLGVSMRQIASAAKVDLSLVMYHFGSKEKLYRAVLERLLIDFNDLRTERLDAFLADNPNPDIIQLFDLMISSWLDLHFWESRRHARLLLRGVTNRDQSLDIPGYLSDPLILRFISIIQKAAPEFSEQELHWAYHSITGALIFFISGSERIKRLSPGICNIDSYSTIRTVLLRMVRDFFSERQHLAIESDPLYKEMLDPKK